MEKETREEKCKKGSGEVPKTNLSFFRTAPWQALYPGEGKKTSNSFSSLFLVTERP